MLDFCASNWWLFLLRGIIAVIFGLLAIFLPGVTLASLVLVWAAFAFADGVVSLFALATGRTESEHTWLIALQGVLGVAVGVITFMNPAITAVALLLYIIAWALAIGVLQIVAAIRLRNEITGEFWLFLSGLISVLFAGYAMYNPGVGALAIAWTIGFYAILFGAASIAFAFKVRQLKPAA